MGCAWSEQPIYVQFAFMLDRVKALAAQHPEWTQKQPFKAVLDGDMKALAASGERGLLELRAATHVANTTEEFAAIVTDWIGTARHPKTGRPYTEMVYQPTLEVLSYLRANGFKTYVVSGGGVEFMRPWIERVYGIPPEQVVGSRAKVKYEVRSGVPVLFRLRWRFRDARMDHVGTGTAPGTPRAPHRRRARMGLRPVVAHWATRMWAGRGAETRVDRCGYEARLEEDLPIPEVARREEHMSILLPLAASAVDGTSSSAVPAPPTADMISIAGGTFLMGSDKHYPEERPAHRVSVDGFWIDRIPRHQRALPAIRRGDWSRDVRRDPAESRRTIPAHCRTCCTPDRSCS